MAGTEGGGELRQLVLQESGSMQQTYKPVHTRIAIAGAGAGTRSGNKEREGGGEGSVRAGGKGAGGRGQGNYTGRPSYWTRGPAMNTNENACSACNATERDLSAVQTMDT